MRIFVSTPTNINKLRTKVEHALKVGKYEVRAQRSLPITGVAPVNIWKEIEQVDAVLQIIGSDQGSRIKTAFETWHDFFQEKKDSIPRSDLLDKDLFKNRTMFSRLTYTQLEAWIAILLNKNLGVIAEVEDQVSKSNVDTKVRTAKNTEPDKISEDDVFDLENHLEMLRNHVGFPRRENLKNHDRICTNALLIAANWKDADSPTKIYLTTRDEKLWSPHAFAAIIDVLLRGSEISPTYLAQKLGVSTTALNQLTDGVQLRLSISKHSMFEVCKKHNLFSKDNFELFVREPNNSQGWRRQIKYVNARSNFGPSLIQIIEGKINLSQREWLKGTEEIGFNWQEKLSDLTHKNVPAAITYLQELYHLSACRMTPFDMLFAAQSDFSGQEWQKRIAKEPSESITHLKFSNDWLANRIVEKLFFSKYKNTKEIKKIRILEGGVGGGHTIFFLLKKILEHLKSRNDIKIEYMGFEIVADMARSMDSMMHGEGMSGERQDLFSELYRRNILNRFVSKSTFIQNSPMETGIADLFNETRSENSLGGIDVFVCSYAFHHVPNGEPLREFLTGTTRRLDRRARSHVLSSMNKERRDSFRENILNYLNRLSYNEAKAKIISQLAGFPEERVYLSFLDHIIFNLYHAEIIQEFADLPKKNWQLDPNGNAIRAIRNPQQKMLTHLSHLLSPNGLVVIADPDGTSGWNLEKVIDDPEIMIANFHTLYDLKELLQDEQRFYVENKDDFVTIGARGEEEFEVYSSDQQGKFFTLGRDPNRGYVLIGRNHKQRIIFS